MDALRLADRLHGSVCGLCNEAAAELRRLHTQRHSLLMALKNIETEFSRNGRQHWPEAAKARAAITKVEDV